MKEHKSNLRALEPVEIRLAAAVRIRYEIARLRKVEEAIDRDAREIALSVVGRPEVVDVVLEMIGGAFADDTESYDQSAVEAFLADTHDLRIGVAAAAAIVPAPEGAAPSGVAPAAGAAPVAGTPASSVAQPSESAPAQPDPEPSAVEAVASRVSAYDVDLPDDYFGVSFDRVKRPEANLIMGEAILAVVDGLSLDASPYKGDRGKVHWRRKLFEETYAYFLAAPPQAKVVAAHESDDAHVERPVADAAVVEVPAPVIAEPVTEAERPVDQHAPAAHLSPESEMPPADPAADAVSEDEQAAGDEGLVVQGASHAVEADPQDVGSDADAGPDPIRGEDEGHGSAELPLIEPVRPIAASGRVIDFPSPAPAPAAADLDPVDPFESSPPHRRNVSVDAHDAAASVEDDRPGAPTYDGPDWEGPGAEAEDDLERNFADRVGFDRDDDDRYAAGGAGSGLDHAAAAALVEAVEVPASVPEEAPRLPVGGVPPRPAIAMPNARPAASIPPRPAVISNGSATSIQPPPRPALAGAGDGVRLAPRPVAVRPPGM